MKSNIFSLSNRVHDFPIEAERIKNLVYIVIDTLGIKIDDRFKVRVITDSDTKELDTLPYGQLLVKRNTSTLRVLEVTLCLYLNKFKKYKEDGSKPLPFFYSLSLESSYTKVWLFTIMHELAHYLQHMKVEKIGIESEHKDISSICEIVERTYPEEQIDYLLSVDELYANLYCYTHYRYLVENLSEEYLSYLD